MSTRDYSFVVSSFLATLVSLRFSKGKLRITGKEAVVEIGYGLAGTIVSGAIMYLL
jgi:hypothetical protein